MGLSYKDLARGHVLVQKKGKVAIATLNRPAALNAVGDGMGEAIDELLRRVDVDPDVNALILTGAGRGFCSGGDMRESFHKPKRRRPVASDPGYLTRAARSVIQRFLQCQVPLVAAINGPAVGLGATMALLCDVTFMAEEARIGDTHTKVGLTAGDGGAMIWPCLIGAHRARELLMAGRLLSGAEAASIGLVNHAVPLKNLLPEALRYAKEIAAMMPWAVRSTKMAINANIMANAATSMNLGMMAESMSTYLDDYREASQAWHEKRRPRFKGR